MTATKKPAPKRKPAWTRLPAPREPDAFKLRLYVAGKSPKSIRAFANLTRLCDEHLAGRYRIEVIDLLEHPEMARGNRSTTKSKTAIVNIKRVCEQHLDGRYELEVIDIQEQANLARDEQIVAVPTSSSGCRSRSNGWWATCRTRPECSLAWT